MDFKTKVEKIINQIKDDSLEGTIVDYEVQSVQGLDDSDIGHAVIIELKSSYGYTDDLLDLLKNMFDADCYWIRVVGKRLVIVYLCYDWRTVNKDGSYM